MTTEITDENIDSFIGGNQSVVLEFYAPWCHWCNRMFSDYEGVWEHFNSPQSSEFNKDVLIARVNAQGNPKVIAKYEAYAYPTILFIPAGSQSHTHMYNGSRAKWDFIRWTNQLLVNYSKPKPQAQPQENIVQPEEKQQMFDRLVEELTNIEPQPIEHLENSNTDSEEQYIHPQLIPEILETHDSKPENIIIPTPEPSTLPEEAPQKPQEEKHNHEKKDPVEEDMNETEEEYEILYEVNVNEDSADFLAKWRAELTILNDLVKELHEDLASSITDIENGIHEMKALQKEEKLRDLEHFERIEEKIEGLDLHILQRNRVESTQTRLNLTHLFIFSSLGFVVGCAISIIFVKIQKTEKPLHNKV